MSFEGAEYDQDATDPIAEGIGKICGDAGGVAVDFPACPDHDCD